MKRIMNSLVSFMMESPFFMILKKAGLVAIRLSILGKSFKLLKVANRVNIMTKSKNKQKQLKKSFINQIE